MAKVTFRQERCKGCYLCIHICPKKIILSKREILNAKGYHPTTIDEMEKCIGCGFCSNICPDCVITVEK